MEEQTPKIQSHLCGMNVAVFLPDAINYSLLPGIQHSPTKPALEGSNREEGVLKTHL